MLFYRCYRPRANNAQLFKVISLVKCTAYKSEHFTNQLCLARARHFTFLLITNTYS